MRHREVRFPIRLRPQWIAGVADNVLTDWETFMSVSALSSSSSSYWEKMLAQMKGSSESQSQDNLAGKLFGNLDSDGDGTLSLSETGLSKDLYSKIDADGDALVTQTELQKAIETQRNAMLTSMQLGQSQTGSSTEASSTGQPNARDMLSAIMNGQIPGGARGAGRGPGPEGSGDDLASKLFSDLDSDSSGGLSASETGLSQSSFDAMDTDQDGSVSAEELSAALEKQRQTMMTNLQSGQSQSTSQSQTDSTNSSDQSDAQSLLSSIMNGQMPPPPMQRQGASGQSGSDDLSTNLFSSLDSDSSGGLSADETGLSQSVFDSMDVNQDGSVSADELATALEKQRAAMMGNGQNSGQGSSKRTEMAQNFLSAMANNAYQTLSPTTATTQGVEAVA